MAKTKFYGSLARRILVICLTLIIVPLLFYSAIIWERDWKIKLDTIFSEFEMIGETSLQIYDEWRQIKRLQLQNMRAEDVSTLFVINQDKKVVYSSIRAMEEDQFFSLEELDEAFSVGENIFVALNPFTNQQEVFLIKRFKNELRGLSVNGLEWIKLFAANTQFDISIKDKAGGVVISTARHSDHAKEVVFHLPLPDLDLRKAFFLRNKHLALALPMPDAQFDLFLEISRAQIKQLEGGNVFRRLAEFMILLIILGGIGAWWLVHRMAKPYDQLEHVMDAVEVKDYDRRYESDRFGFEINTLGMKFNEMLEILLRNMEEAKTERVKAELLMKELQIGQTVQKELLPKEIPQFPGLEFGRGFVPAKEVGGDFYDLFVKNENQMMVAIADASDKGVSACLYSLIARSLLRSFAQTEDRLSNAILHTNNLFYRDVMETSNFVTAWIGYYDVEGQTLAYSNAGHYPALLVHPNGEIEQLTTEGIALGVTPSKEIEVRTVKLAPGSLLLLYTDGVVEAHNEKGERFGKRRLFELVKMHRGLGPQPLVDQVIEEVSQFAEHVAQHDDLTLLCLKNS